MLIRKNNKGFTLLELLVVIAIIGLFASVIMASLSSARTKTQTAKRSDDFQKISQALERYLIDNDNYPIGGYSTCSGIWTASFDTALSPYLSDVPIDPINRSDGSCIGAGQYYSFWNPTTWAISPECPVGTILLYAAPASGIPVFRSDCNNGLNSIIFHK